MFEDSRAFFLPKSNPLRRALIWRGKTKLIARPGRGGLFRRGREDQPRLPLTVSTVMPGVVIRSGAVVTRAIVGEDSVVSAGCIVGAEAREGESNLIALVGQHTELPENFVVKPGDQIDSDMLRLERSLNV